MRNCPLCQHTVTNRDACRSCGFVKGCTLIRCSNCGYEFVHTSKLVGWAKKVARHLKRRKK